MKFRTIVRLFPLLILGMIACSKSDEGQKLFAPVNLIGPVENSEIELDIFEEGGEVVFEWSALPTATDQTRYTVLFDREGTKFEMPAASVVSDNEGKATSLTLTHEELDAIAEQAGVGAKKSGRLKWAVDASSGSNIVTSVAAGFTVKRPSGLGITPAQLFLTGLASEGGGDLQAAVPFRKVSSGVFEVITKLNPGSYKVVSEKTGEAIAYYFENGELFRGDQPMTFTGEASPALIRIDFNNTVGSQKVILSAEMIVTATQARVATLTYTGNHVFENTNAVFNFLKPGGAGAPDWLGWEEERYKFRLKTDQGDEFYGSPYNADMNASSDPLSPVFNQRPDGSQPATYFSVYPVDPNDFWAGSYKMASRFDGRSMKVKLDFNPAKYQHSFTLN